MVEYETFDTQDKHKLAFGALSGSRGQEMGKLLGIDVKQSEACVNCHSVPARGAETRVYRPETEGVTCVGCHGAYEEWVGKHQSGSKEWHDLDRLAKERLYGMTDLWDPLRRAETCIACHVGNYKQGKVVTHAMYAAGHPPLSSFEAATFSDAQPRHWEYLREKTNERLDRLKPYEPRNLERTQLVVVNGLVALRDSMNLFADQAEANKPEPVGARWPDFARFDCYACHHELQAQDGASWRQVRRRDGRPGRPTSPDWPSILIQLGIEAAGPQQAAARQGELKQQMESFHGSLKARPFGDLQSAARDARTVAARADSLIKTLSHTVFDQDLARQLLSRLCKIAGDPDLDYDSARQIAWAFRIIYEDSLGQGAKPDPVIDQVLAGLAAKLALRLPSATQQVKIEETLPNRLKFIADFDPGSFKAQFGMIAKRL
jgi:hypothetical protein